ncbi:hypothetical protein [Frankia sp. AgB32]|uniref:hypothetical protein n=1 Tax=Frankia sp. AgB32 TaxID=631119 RepID=UPI00200E66B7|nr:hypothetical protein [Frankia sp. AgB32]MCK9895221.1 hypothetical protein [Frankia sp. AgB32]
MTPDDLPAELLTLAGLPDRYQPTDADRADADETLSGLPFGVQGAVSVGAMYTALYLLATGTPQAEVAVRQALARGAAVLGLLADDRRPRPGA